MRASTPLVLLLLLAAAPAAAQDAGRPLAGLRAEGGTFTRVEDGRTVTVRARGEVRVSEDGTRVLSIAEGGYLILSEDAADGTTRRMNLRPAAGGEVARTWLVDGRIEPLDGQAEAWLARMLAEAEPMLEVRARPAFARRPFPEAARRARIESRAALERARVTHRPEMERAHALHRAEMERARALHRAEVERARAPRRGEVERARAVQREALEHARSLRTGAAAEALRQAERALRQEREVRTLEQRRQGPRTRDGRRIWIL